MNDSALHQLSKTWDIEFRVLEKVIKKLHNQLRAQKELRVLKEMIRKCRQVKISLNELIEEKQREERVQKLQTFLTLCVSTIETCEKYGLYAHQFIVRKFLLEFSTISYSCSSRFYYLLKEIHPFLIKLLKREQSLLEYQEKKEQTIKNNTILISE